jgi:hypothetical protein
MGVSRSMLRRRARECCKGEARQRPVADVPEASELRGGSLRHHAAAASTGAGTQIDHKVGAAYGVFVVFDHDQRIALGAQLIQGAEERDIVPRVKPDGGLVKYIADPLQIRAELRCEADALRFAAGESRGRAIQLQIAQADIAEKGGARGKLGEQIARNFALAADEFELLQVRGKIPHGQIRECSD